jgi:putative phosphoribosyl transferase
VSHIPVHFADRRDAGRRLALVLAGRDDLQDPVVLALPRGGVPVAAEVAEALAAPLDVLVVRKLGVPNQPELAMGAVASGNVEVLNREVLSQLHLPQDAFDRVLAEEKRELARRERLYRGDRPPLEVRGRRVVLVDDGIATGSTVEAAIRALRARGAGAVVVAVPVAPVETVDRLQALTDGVVALSTPEPFVAISLWYGAFPQVSDREVQEILEDRLGR